MRKKILSIALALCMIICMMPSVAMAAETSVAIDETNFPDENFRSYIKTNFDTDGDISLSSTEIAKVTSIQCTSKNITSLKGIEYFTELTKLYCFDNELTSLDLRKNTKLTDLRCMNNQLESVDVSGCTLLHAFFCGDNKLTTLDVSNNKELTNLDFSSNQLTSIDVSNNTKLVYLECDSNKLASIAVNTEAALSLVCNSNELTSIDVSNAPNLSYLNCNDNKLTELDVSYNTALSQLKCNNNMLTFLDLSKNTALEKLWCDNNQLTTLDASAATKAAMIISCNSNRYIIETAEDGTFDLSTLAGGNFDVSNIKSYTGGTITDGILTFDANVNTFSYQITTKSNTITFTLHKHDFGEYQSNGDGTHTVVCQSEDCGDTITEKCSGGEATLTEKAVCSVCKSAYGSYLPGSIEISGTTASAKRGKEVTINVNLDKNTGLAALRIKLEYDKEALELKSVTNGEIFGDEYFFGLDENFASDTDEAILMWNAAKTDETATETGMVTPVDGNTTKTGTLATLTFTIKDEAAIGDTPVKFTCISSDYDAIDARTDALTVTTNDAKVTVVSFIYGDINDDDSIDLNDIIQLRRYLARWKSYTVNMDSADVDMDGKVTLRDVTILEYHVAGWEKYSTLPVTA